MRVVEAIKESLSEEIIRMKKRTFTLPFELWMHKGLFEGRNNEILNNLEQWFDPIELEKIRVLFQNGRINWSRYWSLYVLSEWIIRNL